MSVFAGLLGARPTTHTLSLRFVDVPINVLTNDAGVRAALARYYDPLLAAPGGPAACVVRLLQGTAPVEGTFVDIVRNGARRVKEAVREVPGGRLILKRASGVLMGIGPGEAFALGDLRTHLNQAVNLINACYAKAVRRRGHLLLHASAVAWGSRAVALAGVPGAGKSTAALHLVEDGFRFLSNDRVLARPDAGGVEVLGYPKQPRVNPGTLLNHPRLTALIEREEREALQRLDPGVLWALERKRDVDLDAFYGRGTVTLQGRLEALVLLLWSRDGQGLDVRPLTTVQTLEQLDVFHKDLGVFDLDQEPLAQQRAEPARYRALLDRLTVVAVTGRADFDALVKVVRSLPNF